MLNLSEHHQLTSTCWSMHTAPRPEPPLPLRGDKTGSEICSHNSFRLQCACDCVSDKPDIFREVRRVKFLRKRMWSRRQKHGNSGTHPAALAAPGVNCCLETKQRSSLFYPPFLFIPALKPTIFIMICC